MHAETVQQREFGQVDDNARPRSLPILSQPSWKHDVFISFRGKDTRRKFLSHLMLALRRAEVVHYRDDGQGQRGLEVQPMLLEAIRHSRIALVLFSKNYAESRWCLDELVEIMNCNNMYKDCGHMVFPIFYDVEPSNVRAQTGEFGDGYRRCMDRHGNGRTEEWRTALKLAGNVSGWELKDVDEALFIEKIIKELDHRIYSLKSSTFVDHAIGRDSNVKDIISLLNIGSDTDVRVIGIYGINGIGKTTLAKLTYSRIYSGFGSTSFLENIGDATEEDLVRLQKKLVDDLKLELHRFMSGKCDSKRNIAEIRPILSSKKILLVLDDMKDKNQAALLGGERESLGPGSRIIITTRDEQLLDHLNVDEKYMVPMLSPKESLQLFSIHAFNRNDPVDLYQEDPENIVHYTRGHPVVVKTFGTALAKEEIKDQWFSKTLQKLVENPNLNSIWHDLLPHQPVERHGGLGGAYAYCESLCTGIRTMTVDVVPTELDLIKIGPMVECIKADHIRSGSLIRSKKYGGHRAGQTYYVRLDYPKEYLTSISGHVTGNNTGVIKSILFRSNEKDWGPYGEASGREFHIDLKDGEQVVGFCGKYGAHLDSIGAYSKPVSSPYHPNNIGPFGSQDSINWDDGKHQDIRQIDLVFDSMIRSISILYDNYGHQVGPFMHGRDERARRKRVSLGLDHPNEYVTSMSGYTTKHSNGGATVLQSLTIHTNKKSYGPYGDQAGTPFEAVKTGVKIVGFYGRCGGDSLESIGAYIESVPHIYPLKGIGPFGGEGGAAWDDGLYTDLRQISIKWGGAFIGSVCFTYYQEGRIIQEWTHGADVGLPRTQTWTLERDEYITRISGYYDTHGNDTDVKSLKFESNKRTYGPHGTEEGTYFLSAPYLGKIVGFYGRSSEHYLISIGAHFAPVFHIHPREKIEPFGGDGGGPWDDGRHSYVQRINISYGLVVEGIFCSYNDTSWWTEVHHGGKGGNWYTIKLDYPNEYIVSMSGYVGRYHSYIVVKSLTFQTSYGKKHGPVGLEEGTPFSFTTNNGKIIGFHGQSGVFIDSIGVHVEVSS